MHGEKSTYEEGFTSIFIGFFQTIFTSSNPSRIDEIVKVVQSRITDIMRATLDHHLCGVEV